MPYHLRFYIFILFVCILCHVVHHTWLNSWWADSNHRLPNLLRLLYLLSYIRTLNLQAQTMITRPVYSRVFACVQKHGTLCKSRMDRLRFELRTVWLWARCTNRCANDPCAGISPSGSVLTRKGVLQKKSSSTYVLNGVHLPNRAYWIWTNECSSQSAVPYRLANALYGSFCGCCQTIDKIGALKQKALFV